MNPRHHFRSPARTLVRLVALAAILAGSARQAEARHTEARPAHPAPALIDNFAHMDANNLDMFVTNHGSFAYDLSTGNAGLEYPKGAGKWTVFAAGFWIGAKVGSDIRIAAGEYKQEYVPGPMRNGTNVPDELTFNNYKIVRGNTTDPDYLNWPVVDGAPLDSLGQPTLLGDAMVWSVYNDADPAAHTNDDGSTSPLGVEVQQSTFAFNRSGPLSKVIFLRFKVRNKGANQLDSAYVSLWADPDLGGFTDDLVGCDTTLSLGYCYNATNADQDYGSSPPAVGFALLRGPLAAIGMGATDTLGMTAFARYINGTDPVSAVEVYNRMQGLNPDGSPVHVQEDPLQPITPFEVSGLNLANISGPTNWLDSNPSDRRLFITSGPFAMAPGESQDIVWAICIGQGTDRLASVDDLRNVTTFVRVAFQAGQIMSPEIPTAISATLMESVAQLDRVRLVWLVPKTAGVTAAVSRREQYGDWVPLGAATPEGASRLAFEDATVRAGARYQYRLLVRDGLGEEATVLTWVNVPGEAVPTAPSLRIAAANPSGDQVKILYGLPVAGAARLDVYDIRGRRVATLTNAHSAAGWHEMTWSTHDGQGHPVASGMYLLRLESDAGAVVRKLTVTR